MNVRHICFSFFKKRFLHTIKVNNNNNNNNNDGDDDDDDDDASSPDITKMCR